MLDADGLGSLWVDGVQLSGGQLLADNVWESVDRHYRYTLMGGNLIIGRGTDASASTMNGSITVKGWSASPSLGITLDNTALTNPAAINIYTGEQRAQLIGIEIDTNILPGDPLYNTYKWGATSWAADGTLTGGVAQANFADVITGSALADKIFGLGGNDALDGGAGNDEIDGGVGDDLIGGGAGSDNIKGGDGNDFIVGAESLSVLQRSKPTDSWTLPAGATLLSQGNTWGTYTQDGTVFWYRPNPVVVDDAPDVIDAGAGDDWVDGSANFAPTNAIDLVATYASQSGIAGRFDCEIRRNRRGDKSRMRGRRAGPNSGAWLPLATRGHITSQRTQS